MNELKARADRAARELMPAANTLLLAKANAELWAERVAPVQRELLRTCKITYGNLDREKQGQPITDPKDSWLMGDDQAAHYFAELDAEYRRRGWLTDADGVGYCPALMAGHLVTKAEHAMIVRAAEFIPGLEVDVLLCAGLEKYHKAIDLLIGLVVNHPSYRKPSLAA